MDLKNEQNIIAMTTDQKVTGLNPVGITKVTAARQPGGHFY